MSIHTASPLTALRKFRCDVSECAPCPTPSFCQICREADSKLTRLPKDKLSRQRPTAQMTIEAVKQGVRDRGVSALNEPHTRERLQQCDSAAIAEIDPWLFRRGIAR
jgi:hypothetical protein